MSSRICEKDADMDIAGEHTGRCMRIFRLVPYTIRYCSKIDTEILEPIIAVGNSYDGVLAVY